MKTLGRVLSVFLVFFAFCIFIFFIDRENIPILGDFFNSIFSFVKIFYFNNYVHILFEFIFIFLFLVVSYYNLIEKKKEIVASISVFCSLIGLVLLSVSTYQIFTHYSSSLCTLTEDNIYRCINGISDNAELWYTLSQVGFFIAGFVAWHNVINSIIPNNTFSTYCKHFIRLFLWVLLVSCASYYFFYKISDYSTAPLSIHQWGPPLIITVLSMLAVVTVAFFISDYAFQPAFHDSTESMDYDELKEKANELLEQKEKERYGEKKKVGVKKKIDAAYTVGANEENSALPVTVQNADANLKKAVIDETVEEKKILISTLSAKGEAPKTEQNNASYQDVFSMYQEKNTNNTNTNDASVTVQNVNNTSANTTPSVTDGEDVIKLMQQKVAEKKEVTPSPTTPVQTAQTEVQKVVQQAPQQVSQQTQVTVQNVAQSPVQNATQNTVQSTTPSTDQATTQNNQTK